MGPFFALCRGELGMTGEVGGGERIVEGWRRGEECVGDGEIAVVRW